ncbi:MAG: leucine-rich repeat domain-containing protein [Candidatus Thorarchaeota archaeon]
MLNLLTSGKTFSLHHKEIKTIDLSEIGQLKELQYLDLQSNHLDFLDLFDISKCKYLRRINLEDNNFSEIDMNPLNNCNYLEEISLARNQLSEIDLSPLQKKKALKSLSLADNNIQTIDLFPLSSCDNLRSLNLIGNLLHIVNLAPILLCIHLERVELSGNPSFKGRIDQSSDPNTFPTILIDTLVKNALQFGKPGWFTKVQSVFEIEKPHLTELLNRLDWQDIRSKMAQILRRADQNNWFDNQKRILKSLDMKELIGIDATLQDILLQIPNLQLFDDSRGALYQNLINMIRNQIQNKGSTHFFDVDTMSTTGASVVISDILNRRREEIEETVLAIQGGSVFLRPLWKTCYGFEVMKKLGMRDKTDYNGLQTLEKRFESLDMTLKYREVKHWPFGESTVKLSREMGQLLNKMAGLPIVTTP